MSDVVIGSGSAIASARHSIILLFLPTPRFSGRQVD